MSGYEQRLHEGRLRRWFYVLEKVKAGLGAAGATAALSEGLLSSRMLTFIGIDVTRSEVISALVAAISFLIATIYTTFD